MFARHRARVFNFMHRIVRSPTIAEDIISLVFLDVWRSATVRGPFASFHLAYARLHAGYPSNTASAPLTASAESITARSSAPACTEMFSAKKRASVV